LLTSNVLRGRNGSGDAAESKDESGGEEHGSGSD
jgi:hypothetical protein